MGLDENIMQLGYHGELLRGRYITISVFAELSTLAANKPERK